MSSPEWDMLKLLNRMGIVGLVEIVGCESLLLSHEREGD